MKSLHARRSDLADFRVQLKVLNGQEEEKVEIPSFEATLHDYKLFPLKAQSVDTMQINMGYMCNQICSHCHVDAGPDRKEIMTRETMQQCLEALENSRIHTVDLTGGAPEMNPDFRWFVTELKKRNAHIMVRSNLTIILANPKYNDLPEFFRDHQVEVISSLPYYTKRKTDSQRGDGVFEKSIKALQMLNAVGYGANGSELVLNLVYNPSGAFLPPSQKELEAQFKRNLARDYGITFNSLYTITNLPISRFLEYLLLSGNYERYMEKLVNSFNPVAAVNVMCRTMISVGWDGYLYDCDFNQMLQIGLEAKAPRHISAFDEKKLAGRTIVVNQHCYGCTAGAGSSCGGVLAE